LGWTFQPQTSISVTALGAFNYVVPSEGGLEVGLWDSSGVLLASKTITAGSLSLDQSLYESITPVTLAADQTYYLGAFSPAGSFESIVVIPNDGIGDGYATMSPEIQLGNVAYEQNSDFEFPDITANSPGSAFIAPNFEFEPAPEPSTLCLLGAGSFVLLMMRHRG